MVQLEIQVAILTEMTAGLIKTIHSMDWLSEHKKSQCQECTAAGLVFMMLPMSRERLAAMMCGKAQGHVANVRNGRMLVKEFVS